MRFPGLLFALSAPETPGPLSEIFTLFTALSGPVNLSICYMSSFFLWHGTCFLSPHLDNHNDEQDHGEFKASALRDLAEHGAPLP